MQYICNIKVFGDKNRNYFFIRFLHKEIKVNRRQTKDRTVHMCMCVFVEVCVMVFARTYDWLLHYVVKLKHCYHMYQSLTHNTVGCIIFIVICLSFCPHFVFQTFFVIFLANFKLLCSFITMPYRCSIKSLLLINRYLFDKFLKWL